MWTCRAFLKTGGLALYSVLLVGTPLFLSRAANAALDSGPHRRRKVLVTIFQRGAMDGLMAVTPFTDPILPNLRPRLAMTPDGSAPDAAPIDLDGRFGLHPAFAPMAPLFREGRLAIVHGVGSPDATRSHFDAQDYMETGTPGRKGTTSGWLNRAVGLLGHKGTPFRAVSMTPALPRSLYGDAPALAVADLKDFGPRLGGNSESAQKAKEGFERLYVQSAQALLQRVGRESFEAINMLSKIEGSCYRPAQEVEYPRSPLGKHLRQIAQLIKANVGLEVAFAESGGWDTHVQQGTTNGSFSRRAADLFRSIAAFWTDLEPNQDDVVLIGFQVRVRPYGSRKWLRRNRSRTRLLPLCTWKSGRWRQNPRNGSVPGTGSPRRRTRPARHNRLSCGIRRSGGQTPPHLQRPEALSRVDGSAFPLDWLAPT